MTFYKVSQVSIFFVLAIALWSEQSRAVAGMDFGIKIPVRLGVFTGVQSGKYSYEADKKDISATSFLLGLDFNVPIPPISSLIGLQAWYMADSKTGNSMKSGFFFIGPYLGYSGKADDIFVGGGISMLATELSDGEVTAPTTKTNLFKTTPCAILGWRHYFKAKITTGLGITGYACQSGEYEKSVHAATDTNTTVSDKVTATGGTLYFIVTWGEERKLM